MDRNPICTQGKPECRNATIYEVAGTKGIRVATTPINASHYRIINRTEYSTSFVKLRQRANEQYNFDRINVNTNKLTELTRAMQCELRRMKHSHAVATAQYNGWLAESQLGFPKCAKLIATGKTVTAIQCTSKMVIYNTEVTKCGSQPKFGNSTINLDGWELVKLSPCYWSQGFVNFNDEPYAYQNGNWTPIQLDYLLANNEMIEMFKYQDLRFLQYDHLNNPAYSDAMVSHMNIMADIAAAMNEHAEWNRSNPIHPSPTIVFNMKSKEEKPLSF